MRFAGARRGMTVQADDMRLQSVATHPPQVIFWSVFTCQLTSLVHAFSDATFSYGAQQPMSNSYKPLRQDKLVPDIELLIPRTHEYPKQAPAQPHCCYCCSYFGEAFSSSTARGSTQKRSQTLNEIPKPFRTGPG